jgi:hypothetical protein
LYTIAVAIPPALVPVSDRSLKTVLQQMIGAIPVATQQRSRKAAQFRDLCFEKGR